MKEPEVARGIFQELLLSLFDLLQSSAKNDDVLNLIQCIPHGLGSSTFVDSNHPVAREPRKGLYFEEECETTRETRIEQYNNAYMYCIGLHPSDVSELVPKAI
jgi:hypothetical protein